jgi:cytochrome c-type biogenesis protein CcmH/NrfG
LTATDERVAFLRGLLAEDPNDAFALYGLAFDLAQTGAVDEAESLFRRLLQVDPDHLYGYYQLGRLLLDDARPEEAAGVIRAGLTRAERAGDAKAAGELRALLDAT